MLGHTVMPCREVIFCSVWRRIMDLRAPAAIENRTLLEWSVISNNSRSLAVFINYLSQVISWAVC